ncbi:MAG: sigma 54-interacting transcriptional regulator [Bryobacterales bacterium]|nr:sigma 54-interacting transcriptional regulator [Bryobacterales bacterium]
MAKLNPQWRQPRILEAIFDQMSDALLLYDPDRRIAGVNRAAERLLGSPAKALIGKECREVFGCTECDPICGILMSIGDVPSMSPATVRLHLANGLERTVVVRTSQFLDESGQLEGVVATIQDVSGEFEPHRREIIADSPLMADLMRFIRRVAMSEATTVLLEGENGVGKDLIAATLHSLSPRQAEPFIAINCAAIPETLLESELFGYEKGAFTDAKQQKRGLFELADNGTLFLDEIGDIPLVIQAKLLRVLEDQQFRRVGGTSSTFA